MSKDSALLLLFRYSMSRSITGRRDMQNIKVELNGVAGLFIPFSLIVGAILTAKLIELGACWLFNLFF